MTGGVTEANHDGRAHSYAPLMASLNPTSAPTILTEILELYAGDDPTKIRALTFPAGARKVEIKDTAKDCDISDFWLYWSKADGQLRTAMKKIYAPDSGQGTAEENQNGNDSKTSAAETIAAALKGPQHATCHTAP